MEVRTNRLVNAALAGEYHSVFKGHGMDLDEVREYVPGDEVRAIDRMVTECGPGGTLTPDSTKWSAADHW
jgi:hypothetical protein